MLTAVCLKISRLGVSPATNEGHLVAGTPRRLSTIHFSPFSLFFIFFITLCWTISTALSSKRLLFDLSNLTMAHRLHVLFSTTLAYSKEKNLLTALLLPLSPPGVQRLP